MLHECGDGLLLRSSIYIVAAAAAPCDSSGTAGRQRTHAYCCLKSCVAHGLCRSGSVCLDVINQTWSPMFGELEAAAVASAESATVLLSAGTCSCSVCSSLAAALRLSCTPFACIFLKAVRLREHLHAHVAVALSICILQSCV